MKDLYDNEQSRQCVESEQTPKSGVAGVTWHKRAMRWTARISVSGKSVSLGFFKSVDDAIAARREAERLYKRDASAGRNIEKRRRLPEAEYLRSRLAYDEATGELTWKRRPEKQFKRRKQARSWNAKNVGKRAGSVSADGSRIIGLDGSVYAEHRVIWKIVHGKEPGAVWHVDGDRANNVLANLEGVEAK